MKTYYPNGLIKEITPYEIGFKNGVSYLYYSNGTIRKKGRYEYDLPVGIWKDWFIQDNKHLKDIGYGNDKGFKRLKFTSQYYDVINLRQVKQFLRFGDYKILEAYDRRGRSTLIRGNGHHIEYFANGGSNEEFRIKDGKKHGAYKIWFPDGTVHEEGMYEDDVKLPYTHHQYNGVKLLETGNGPCIYKYFNGQPKYRINYLHYKPDGKYECFYTNGAIRTTGEYFKGEKAGVWLYFDLEGNIINQERYHTPDREEI